MNTLEILLISLSLSLDAFAISISSGGTMKLLTEKNALKMALFFGTFQSIMPVIGYFAGISMLKYISVIDHWIAFTLLNIIGIKMIYESREIEKIDNIKNEFCPFNIYTLTILSITTSIDALVIGITFSTMKIKIIIPVIIIGLITFLMSLIGIKIGYKGKHFFENKMELIGGIVLILLGFKILMQHII